MAGSAKNQAGSAEYLCLHEQPQYLSTTQGVQTQRSYLYGTEYGAVDSPPAFSNLVYCDIPCSVCYASARSAQITIPGRITCPSTWLREYYGYLMTEGFSNDGSRVPVCVDVNADGVPASQSPIGQSVLLFIENSCQGIACPPYTNGAEITCVVCTK